MTFWIGLAMVYVAMTLFLAACRTAGDNNWAWPNIWFHVRWSAMVVGALAVTVTMIVLGTNLMVLGHF